MQPNPILVLSNDKALLVLQIDSTVLKFVALLRFDECANLAAWRYTPMEIMRQQIRFLSAFGKVP